MSTPNAAQVEQYFRDAIEFFASDRCTFIDGPHEDMAVFISAYVAARAELDAADRHVFFGQ